MDDTSERDTAEIQLDAGRHRELFAAIGCTSDLAIAAETGVSDRTVRRARDGIIGEVFMAQTIAALQRHARKLRDAGHEPPTLDELFTVVTNRAA